MKKLKSKHPQDQGNREVANNKPLGASDNAEVLKSSEGGEVESEHIQYHEEVADEQWEVFGVPEENKENVDSVHQRAKNCGEKVYKKKHQFFGGGLEIVPSLSPLRQTQSLGCLRQEEEEVVPLCRATSNIQLSEGKEVILSDLVPAQQVSLITYDAFK